MAQERITKNTIERTVEFLNKEYDLNLNINYDGGARIEYFDGRTDISCKGTKSEIYWQLRAIQGLLSIKRDYGSLNPYHIGHVHSPITNECVNN